MPSSRPPRSPRRHPRRAGRRRCAGARLRPSGRPDRGQELRGPSCPGFGWTCTTSGNVIQTATPGGRNVFVCTSDACTVTQTAVAGGNRARCIQKGTAQTQSCTIVQVNQTGENVVLARQESRPARAGRRARPALDAGDDAHPVQPQRREHRAREPAHRPRRLRRHERVGRAGPAGVDGLRRRPERARPDVLRDAAGRPAVGRRAVRLDLRRPPLRPPAGAPGRVRAPGQVGPPEPALGHRRHDHPVQRAAGRLPRVRSPRTSSSRRSPPDVDQEQVGPIRCCDKIRIVPPAAAAGCRHPGRPGLDPDAVCSLSQRTHQVTAPATSSDQLEDLRVQTTTTGSAWPASTWSRTTGRRAAVLDDRRDDRRARHLRRHRVPVADLLHRRPAPPQRPAPGPERAGARRGRQPAAGRHRRLHARQRQRRANRTLQRRQRRRRDRHL